MGKRYDTTKAIQSAKLWPRWVGRTFAEFRMMHFENYGTVVRLRRRDSATARTRSRIHGTVYGCAQRWGRRRPRDFNYGDHCKPLSLGAGADLFFKRLHAARLSSDSVDLGSDATRTARYDTFVNAGVVGRRPEQLRLSLCLLWATAPTPSPTPVRSTALVDMGAEQLRRHAHQQRPHHRRRVDGRRQRHRRRFHRSRSTASSTSAPATTRSPAAPGSTACAVTSATMWWTSAPATTFSSRSTTTATTSSTAAMELTPTTPPRSAIASTVDLNARASRRAASASTRC